LDTEDVRRGSILKKEYGEDQVFDFSLGNPDLEPPAAFSEALRSLADDPFPGMHGYMANAGFGETRDAVASFLSSEQGIPIAGKNIIMTCGAGGALNIALKAVLNPGDTVLAQAPCFMEYKFYTDNHGGLFEMLPPRPDLDLDIAAIEKAIHRKTAAVIINSPNNPSGKVYPENTIRELSAMLERKNREIGRTVYLICDEPYRKIVYDGVQVPSVLRLYRNTLVATSYSKDLSVPGERIGWLAVHPEADDAENIVNGAILCNRILGYVNAPALMQRIVGKIPGVSVDISRYQSRRDMIMKGLGDIGYEFVKPEGTFYLFPKAPGGDDLALVNALKDERILTVPGRGFGAPGYFRIVFCVPERSIAGSLPGFRRVYEKLMK
jgi:aspartate aminotransferase